MIYLITHNDKQFYYPGEEQAKKYVKNNPQSSYIAIDHGPGMKLYRHYPNENYRVGYENNSYEFENMFDVERFIIKKSWERGYFMADDLPTKLDDSNKGNLTLTQNVIKYAQKNGFSIEKTS